MTLDQFQDLKRWHQRHEREQPLEKHVWDAVLTLWMMFESAPSSKSTPMPQRCR